MVKLSFLIALLVLTYACSDSEKLVYSYEEFDESDNEMSFQGETHFYPDGTFTRFNLERADRDISRITIYQTGFYQVEGDTLVQFHWEDNLKIKDYRYLLKDDKMIPITKGIPYIIGNKINYRSKKGLKHIISNVMETDSIICWLHCYGNNPAPRRKVHFNIEFLDADSLSCSDYEGLYIDQ